MWNTDIRRYGPKAYVCSIVIDLKPFMSSRCACASTGKWTPSETLLPMGGGVDRDAWGENVPPEVAKQADAVRDQDPRRLEPVRRRDQGRQGHVKVAAGHTHDRG